jgi:hypothetical protein
VAKWEAVGMKLSLGHCSAKAPRYRRHLCWRTTQFSFVTWNKTQSLGGGGGGVGCCCGPSLLPRDSATPWRHVRRLRTLSDRIVFSRSWHAPFGSFLSFPSHSSFLFLPFPIHSVFFLYIFLLFFIIIVLSLFCPGCVSFSLYRSDLQLGVREPPGTQIHLMEYARTGYVKLKKKKNIS